MVLREQHTALSRLPGRGPPRGRRATRRRRQITSPHAAGAEQEWWRENGVTDIVSGLRSRHGLVDYGLGGFGIHWLPITGEKVPGQAVAALVQRTEARLAQDRSALAHVDRPNGWLAGDRNEALLQAARDGLPLDEVAETLVASYVDASGGVKLA